MMENQPIPFVHLICAFVLAGLFLAPSSAHGQIDGWSVKAGITSTTGQGEGLLEEDIGRTTGVLIGGATRIGVTGSLSLHPELLFVQKGWTFNFRTSEGMDATSTVTLTYLELPVLGEVKLPVSQTVTPRLLLGPTVGVKLNSDVDVDRGGQLETSDDFLRNTEVGVAFGGGVSVGSGGLDVLIDVRYQLSLNNINDRSVARPDGTSREPPTIRIRGLSLTVGIEL